MDDNPYTDIENTASVQSGSTAAAPASYDRLAINASQSSENTIKNATGLDSLPTSVNRSDRDYSSSVPSYGQFESTPSTGDTTTPATASSNPVGPISSPPSNAPTFPEDNGAFGYKVRLFAVRNFPQSYVIFEASPVLSESRSVEYAGVTPVHLPGSIQIYKRTNSRTFSLQGKLISRNRQQATTNMKYLQLLRGWTMPYFGIRSATDANTEDNGNFQGTDISSASVLANVSSSMLGAPPDVLYLYAYSGTIGSRTDRTEAQGKVNIKKLPVVVTSLNITYPEDVDYIPVYDTGEPFPVKMDVTIELSETHSPQGYEKFSLGMFKRGQLVQF